MQTTRFPEINAIEIHIGSSYDFCQRFGKRVKKKVGDVGGRYSATRGNQNTRYVTVPCNSCKMTKFEHDKQIDLIDEILCAYSVNCVIVKDNLPKKEIHHSRGLKRYLRKDKEWNPKTAREYVALAQSKHLDDVNGCQLGSCETRTTVIGSARTGHFGNSELFNLYARAWRTVWRQTVEKAQFFARVRSMDNFTSLDNCRVVEKKSEGKI